MASWYSQRSFLVDLLLVAYKCPVARSHAFLGGSQRQLWQLPLVELTWSAGPPLF